LRNIVAKNVEILQDLRCEFNYEEQRPSRTILSVSSELAMTEQSLAALGKLGRCLTEDFYVKWDKDRVRLFIQTKDHKFVPVSSLKAKVKKCLRRL
jgi:hypothetical protein